MTTTHGADVAGGSWFHNPTTGELARMDVGPDETGGRRIVADLWLPPGAAVAGAHVHDHLVERFEVLAGRVTFQLAGERHVSRPGDGAVEVPAGVVHDWWNSGEGAAHVRVEVTAEPGAPGRPAERFLAAIQVLWSLAALGRVNAKGMPDPLWLAAIAREFRETIRFTRPPRLVQAVLFGPLAALARRTGRDPRRPQLQGPAAACMISEPDGSRLGELLDGGERPMAAVPGRAS